MKTDYFGEILAAVPGVPGTEKTTGDGGSRMVLGVSPVSPVSPVRKKQPGTASGYGCGKCGANLYHENPDGWECSGCGKTFAVIGGSKGPRIIEATAAPGVKWCRDHLPALLAAGWCQRELFNPRWPLGLALLDVWHRPGLAVELVGGCVRFRWEKATGGQVEQVGRPEGQTSRRAHETP